MSPVRDRKREALSKLANADELIDMGSCIEANDRPIWSILRPDILGLLESAEELAADDAEILAHTTRARDRLALVDPASAAYGVVEAWAA